MPKEQTKELNFVSPNWWLLRNGEKAIVDKIRIGMDSTKYFYGSTKGGELLVWDTFGLEIEDRREYDLMEQLRGEGNIADVTTE